MQETLPSVEKFFKVRLKSTRLDFNFHIFGMIPINIGWMGIIGISDIQDCFVSLV